MTRNLINEGSLNLSWIINLGYMTLPVKTIYRVI